jgi:small-conductance mechanosensitive channel
MKDYYQILGLSAEATAAQVKLAYRKLAVLYHPDVSKSPDAELKIKEINEAYNVLSNPRRRADYDLHWVTPNIKSEVWTPEYRGPFSSTFTPQEKKVNYETARTLVLVMPIIRWLSVGVLALGLVLIVDFFLPSVKLNRKITKMYFSGDVQIVETQDGKYAVSITDHIKYRDQESIIIHASGLLSVPRSIEAEGHSPSKLLISIYGDLIVIPVLLLVLAVLGVFQVGPPLLRVGIGLALVLVGIAAVGSLFSVRILH